MSIGSIVQLLFVLPGTSSLTPALVINLFGLCLAYLALVFGVLFLLFAARYYIAIAAVLLSPEANGGNGRNRSNSKGVLESWNGGTAPPMVSVHIPFFNEKNVAARILKACESIDYPSYEVVVVDDSNDETLKVLKDFMLEKWRDRPRFKIIHRQQRKGFKGGALNEALRHTDPRAQYVLVFDADFVPPPDTINMFLDYFNKHGPNRNGNGNKPRYRNGDLAAVQGYQWHTLNRSENWLTKGVSCEFSGNYMVERTFQEVAGTMKMVAGSVYAIRADLLRKYGWSESLTEDWELTLRLYADGYKVLYTPLIQAPAECPSTLGSLIRQRMRWAEGHTFNVKKHFTRIMLSSKVNLREKLEFLYFAPYYLQSVFLIVGTAAWFGSDFALNTKLPFWSSTFGWTLVFTNLLALPLLSATGLFLERRARRDYPGLFSQFLLIYALAPYQAYASLRGLVEPSEGTWVRTFKTGRIAGFLGRLEPRKVVKKMLPPKWTAARATVGTSARVWARPAAIGMVAIFSVLLIQSAFITPDWGQPAYYFYNQPAPASYNPFPSAPNGTSFLMHLQPPSGNTSATSIPPSQGEGPIFFSEPAVGNISLPYGAAVSVHIWVNASAKSGKGENPGNWTGGCTNVRIDIYDPLNNSIRAIPGADQTETLQLQRGVRFYQASWGHIVQNEMILRGETVVVTIWSSSAKVNAMLLSNSATYASNVDFPIVVPENLIVPVGAGAVVFVLAGLLQRRRGKETRMSAGIPESEAYRGIQRIVITAAAVIFLTLPLVATFNDLLTSLVSASGLSGMVAPLVPHEAAGVSALLRSIGLQAGSAASQVWIAGGFFPVTAVIDWNCSGWQSFVVLGVTAMVGLREIPRRRDQVLLAAVGIAGTFGVNVLRVFMVVVFAYFVGYPAALIFHDYMGTILTLVWLFGFWAITLKHFSKARDVSTET